MPRNLVITLSNIGDLVMTTPVLEALHQRYPAAPIDVIADRRSSALLQATPYIGEIFHRDKRAGWSHQLSWLRRLRERRYDAIVDLRTPFLPWLLRASKRMTKPRRSRSTHAVEQHFDAIRPLTNDIPPGPCKLYLGDAQRQRASELLRALPGQRWLAIGPGANWPGKRWAPQHYQQLVAALANEFDAVIVLGSGDDLDQPFDTATLALPALDLIGVTDLQTVAAVLAKMRAFVGNDSGIGHIATAVACPVVTVFGPGEPRRYRPWGRHASVVEAPGQDLAVLSAEPVADAVTKLLVPD